MPRGPKVVLVIPYSASGVQISPWPCQRLPSLRAWSRMIVAIEDEFERPRRSSSGSTLRAGVSLDVDCEMRVFGHDANMIRGDLER